MILTLPDGRILHTAYSDNNVGDPAGFSLTDQAGATYKGTYIDNSSSENTDPNAYYWEELFNPDIDDTDPDDNYGTLTEMAEIAALQSQLNALQDRAQELNETLSQANANISGAADLANAADQVANATNQHFWTDTNGVHITEVSNEEWNDPNGANYQSGSNSLFNSLGLLFRKGLNYLVNILAGTTPETRGLVLYDGAGNDDSNIIARFLGSETIIGKDGQARTAINSGKIAMVNADNLEMFKAESSGSTITQNITDFIINSNVIYSGNTADVYIFPNGIPPTGKSFILRVISDISFNVNFTVGTAATINNSDNGYNNVFVYDGNNKITVTAGGAGDPEADLEPLYTVYQNSIDAPSFTLGTRTPGNSDGAYSTAIGQDIIANYDYQIAVGKFNAAEDKAVIIGNGTSDNNRNNILTVSNAGALTAAGDITAGGKLSYEQGRINYVSSNTNYVNDLYIGKMAIISGSETLNVNTANTNIDKPVLYGYTFKYNPNVQLTMLNIGGNYYQKCTCASPDTTGFTIRIRAGNAPGNVTVNWLAIGELA